jgi:hypothetical protein
MEADDERARTYQFSHPLGNRSTFPVAVLETIRMPDVVELPLPIESSAHATRRQRGYTISVTNPAGPLPTRLAPAPSFYLTGRQPLRPGVILLAIVVAAGALSSVLYAMSHAGHTHFTSGGSGADRSASATFGGAPAADQKNDDDPNQIDTIVLGDPGDAPVPARRGDHVSSVHPTILIHLPRSGDQVGFIPNTPAGQLLYNWLAAFNQASYPALATALPNAALASATAAQMELRQQTGGFRLLSAKEAQPSAPSRCVRSPAPLLSRASASAPFLHSARTPPPGLCQVREDEERPRLVM